MLSSLFSSSTPSYSYSEVQRALDNNTFDFDSFLSHVTALQLLTVEVDGPYKGRTLLWLFAHIAHQHPQYFLAVWTKFHSDITCGHILIPAESGAHHGKSILWLLVATMGCGHYGPFNVVWERFNPELSLSDFRTKADDSVSILLLITGITNEAGIEPFLKFWKRFNQDFTITDLLDTPQVGPDNGLNLLWFLANFAFKGHPELFHSVWERFNEFLTLDHLRLKPVEGPAIGRTILWLLALTATRRQPKTFLAVWERFKDKFTYEDLTASVELPNNNTVSLCKLILSLEGGVKIVFEAISQMPGMPSPQVLKDISSLPADFNTYANKLFAAKKELYSRLKDMQRQKLLNIPFKQQDLESLFALGEAASSAGYINAFYEIHQLLENTTCSEDQSKAFSKISIMSWYNKIAPEFRAILYYETARQIENEAIRELYLQIALCFAVQMRGNERNSLIQGIAYCFITQKNDHDPDVPYLSPSLLNADGDELDLPRILSLLMVLREQATFLQRPPSQAAAAANESTTSSSADDATEALSARFTQLSFSTSSVSAAAAAAAPAPVGAEPRSENSGGKKMRKPKRHG